MEYVIKPDATVYTYRLSMQNWPWKLVKTHFSKLPSLWNEAALVFNRQILPLTGGAQILGVIGSPALAGISKGKQNVNSVIERVHERIPGAGSWMSSRVH
jgi:hypothetical protein